MAKKDDITSTEKLLELIRKKGRDVIESPGEQPVKRGLFSRKDRPVEGGHHKKIVQIGIDINDSDINFAAVAQVSGKKQKLLEVRRIPLGPGVKKGSNEFLKLLKDSIKDLSGKYKNTSFWATIPSADVETRLLLIPKVPARQVPNAVRWAFQKEISIKESEIFDFSVIETVYSEGEQKTKILAYTAPKNEINSLKQTFIKIGYPLKGISTVPFAIQNLLRAGWIKSSGQNVCMLFIGSDWSRIAIFSKSVLVLSRDIKAGARSMVQAILQTLEKKSVSIEEAFTVSPLEDEIPVEIAENTQNLEKAEKIFADFLAIKTPLTDAASDPKRSKLVFEMFKPALDRVIRQVEMTLEHFAIKFQSNPVDNIYISGELSYHHGIVSYIGKQLGLNVEQVDPFSNVPESKIDDLQAETPLSGDSFVPATGIALSENETTPNFIFTYTHKAKKAFTKRFNQVAYTVFIALISVAMGFFYYQTETVKEIKASIRPLQAELDAYSPKLDRNLMAAVTGETVNKAKAYAVAAGYYLPVAVIAELSKITPENVKLTDVQAIFGTVSAKKIDPSGKILNLEGIVSGNSKFFERRITEYLVRLNKSPFFKQPTVKEKTILETEEGEALKFVLSMSII